MENSTISPLVNSTSDLNSSQPLCENQAGSAVGRRPQKTHNRGGGLKQTEKRGKGLYAGEARTREKERAMAKFSPIEFDHNEFGWGPTSAPELFTDVYVTL